ncbi:zinc-ribbon domain-containing protein [Nakamurella flavida]|uniref:Zinc-ribbon domain-containing protein n=1 Tax=Nakamurella flavida TaxID=363630 RepID=A0A938YQZ0_9ACTN|nr:zinc-ribbon domain-containing protein [Nakamurella flavida]MBM9477814.1 zinc-ribbon domain-containing protein [Nakamurella flavida]MDP9779367.1 hypothetical protein [Nakamurella flavida]
MFFLFGFGSKQRDLGAGQVRTCGRCNNTTQWSRIQQSKQFTVFFIPLARWAKQTVEVCGICGNAVQV